MWAWFFLVLMITQVGEGIRNLSTYFIFTVLLLILSTEPLIREWRLHFVGSMHGQNHFILPILRCWFLLTLISFIWKVNLVWFILNFSNLLTVRNGLQPNDWIRKLRNLLASISSWFLSIGDEFKDPDWDIFLSTKPFQNLFLSWWLDFFLHRSWVFLWRRDNAGWIQTTRYPFFPCLT